ncbi:MAG: 5'-methylthioadenosine/adenosylhomocysteine nucleosidase [Lachnospiraceae bacterium]|nr:5'-methylthioadenosine/adenosylhomocysteine nucleosidase [Lachnospiraceae bacterium]
MKKIGIIGAMELEVETLKSKMTITRTVTKASMTFEEGTLNGISVVIVRSGIGKVNAGMCTQILADVFEVTHIINTGVAGSLKAEINIGDIVVSTDAIYHDMDATSFGYPLGEVPQMGVREFVADSHMIEEAVASCKRVCPEISVYTGRITSGDQFVADKAVKNRIIENFGGSCCEMEGCAIAHASYLNNIPFVIIRAISDKADDSAETDYPTFEKHAAEHSAKLVEDFIARI